MSWIGKYIKRPKAWIFTGWVLNGSIDEIRHQGRIQLLRLFTLLKRYSKTPFVVYMEYKLKEDNTYYLHFHAVGGSFGDIHLIQSLWGRVVRYERPLTDPKVLYAYIRKYTAKTPLLTNDDKQKEYLALTYKAQMCRYSVLRKEAEKEFYLHKTSNVYLVDLLVSEIKQTYRRTRLRSKQGSPMDFVPLLDAPPSRDSDIPLMVHVYKEIEDQWHPEAPVCYDATNDSEQWSTPLLKVQTMTLNQNSQQINEKQKDSFYKSWRKRDEQQTLRLKESIKKMNKKYQGGE